MKQDIKEEKLSKRSVKLVEEMYIERDWSNGRYNDEAFEGLINEEKILSGYPIL